MTSEGSADEIDDETIEVLLDAGQDVRHYLAKVVSNKPIHRLEESWETERPDDLREMKEGETLEPALVLGSADGFIRYHTDEPLSQLQRRWAADLRKYVYAEIRNAQQRLTLDPIEFSTYLLSEGAGKSKTTIADELDVSVEEIESSLENAREKFRTAMRMIDLCDRFADGDLHEELHAWRIHRDPVLLQDQQRSSEGTS